MICVVGSGPAGAACAVALIRQGYHVTMLDAGIELEPNTQGLVRQMAGREPGQWSRDEIAAVKGKSYAGVSGIPLKKAYGSDFAYRQADRLISVESGKIGIKPSFAKGGLSNVWGASILPYLAQDITDWPITLEELVPHYRSVFSFMHLAAIRDNLQDFFPLYSEDFSPLTASHQSEAFLNDLNFNRAQLNSQGIYFGASRLAVLAENAAGDACKTCGMCLHGCPYGLIYNSSQTVDELVRHPNFTYIKDVVVTKFVETADQVEIMGISRIDQSPITYTASQLYIGAGTLATTKIFLDSMEAYNTKLTLKDSQYFLLPLLQLKPTPGAMKEELHTLCQIFLEIFDKEISDRTIHLQIYSYNDHFREAIRAALGIFNPLFEMPVQAGLERLLLVQGYLHSDLSSTISVELRPPTTNSFSQLVLNSVRNPGAEIAVRRVADKLHRARHLLNAWPITPLLRIETPGRSYHAGGTLPMSKNPGIFETDTFGRPHGLKRVHLVDATTFPSIPATTITLSSMANAFRIADSLGQESLSSKEV